MSDQEIIKELEDRDIIYSIDDELISCNINTLAAFINLMCSKHALEVVQEKFTNHNQSAS